MKVLVTGGVGFIGSHLIDSLIDINYEVWSLDVNPPNEYKNSKCKYITKSICEDLSDILVNNFDVVYHLASEVGAGLSMADPGKFVNVNNYGTCNLLEQLRNLNKFPKIILSSSATVYGEATYECKNHGIKYPGFRSLKQLEDKQWEVKCDICNEFMKPLPISESRPLQPNSIYGISKLSQERECISLSRAWGFEVVSFRLFGVFGPRQSLGNPYTGVLAMFSTRVFSDLSIDHYEDGGQLKGYTYIDDVIRAFIKAIDYKSKETKNIFNLGINKPESIKDIALKIIKNINPEIKINCTEKFRVSDTRHSWPDVNLAKEYLNWEAETNFDDGLRKLIDWMRDLPRDQVKNSMNTFYKAEKYAIKKGLPL